VPPPDRRQPHRDFAGRETTRPGPHVDDLAATVDETDAPPDSGSGRVRDFGRELTPVDHHEIRLGRVEASLVRLETERAQGDHLPDTEWAAKIDGRIADLARRVEVCEREREARTRWAPVIKWARGIGGGGVLGALLWASAQLADSGAAAEAARRDRESLRGVVEDVRRLQLESAADHARLLILLDRLGVTP
jgi:hypothetical protein